MNTTNYSVGHQAEKDAASYLKNQGFKIIELNWKTKYCEIDIIAEKSGVTHFIEVKYRKNSNQGDGFDYITPKKLKQMEFAAEFWLAENDFTGECTLAAVEASLGTFKFVVLS